MKDKIAIILGATGLTGGLVLENLVNDDRYDKIKVFSRRPLDKKYNDKVEVILCDLLKLEEQTERFTGDHVFCCIGTTRKKTPDKMRYRQIDYGIPLQAAELCKKNGIDTFVVVSAIGANSKSKIFYNRTKGEMENDVLDIGLDNTYILRPSIITGERDETRIGERIGILITKAVQSFLMGPFKKYRTISAEVIANAMIYVANNGYEDAILSSDIVELLGSGDHARKSHFGH
ncbi:MAG: NAD(P)H-binding protein [Saprospiraceae bacterium]|nr:NAD(P)H-binding protein [Saprospiraceae bacterium]